jgi:uncharacterized membrane protein YgdD (TMEM256/DUF423 family)
MTQEDGAAGPPRGAIWVAAWGTLGVMLGAFGSHGLRHVVAEAHLLDVWETAVRYHLVHSVALLALTLARGPRLPFYLWSAGSVVFAGTLYLRVLLNNPAFGAPAPAGGMLLMAGWASLGLRRTWRDWGGT